MDISHHFHENHKFNYRVAGIIIKDNKVLFNKYPINADFYFLPGGRVKLGESSEDAIRREISEEIKLDLPVDKMLFLAENFFTENNIKFHELCLFFKIGIDEYSVLPRDLEVIDETQYHWIELDKLSNYNIQPEFLVDHLNNLPKVIKHVIQY